ncbi:MAG: family 43 glycosylhydrolase [Clostridia bacterium]|nr:family 43 glycosylhydrolase [Clostridia bacterium]
MMNTDQILPLISSGNCGAIAGLAEQGAFDGITAEEKRLLVFTAAQNGQAAMLRFLFEASHLYSPDPDDQGQTLLHRAAQSGNADTVRFAMDVLGFDPLQGDLCGITPLDLARAAEKPEAFQFLTDRLGISPDQCYRNPVLRGFHPDPSAVRVQDDYYLVTSSFFLFPGLPVFHSRDLVHWQEIGHVVTDLDSSGLASLPGGFGYWAPDISFYRGRFWVVATLRRNEKPFRLQMITSSADPRGPWDPPKFLPLDGIDPSLFTDEDGRRYILLNPGAMIAEINENGDPVSKPRMISFGSARIKPEGPHLIRRNGWYYLFLAEGGTGEGHIETALRSKNLYGPYESCPFNPILGRKNRLSPVQRSGHGKPVQLPDGRWYMVYLCSRPVAGMSLLGRETALDPMTWTADGWPMVNSLKGPSCLQPLPFPNLPVTAGRREAWISPRNDPDRFVSAQGQSLILRCGPDPASTDPCSLLLHRQTEPLFTQSFRICMDSADAGDLGGLAGYYDERSFYLFGIRKESGAYSLVLSEQIGSERKETVLATLPEASVRLSVCGSGLTRTFALFRNGAYESVAVIRTAYLCDEGLPEGKRFTGALYGLAAVGTGAVVFQET